MTDKEIKELVSTKLLRNISDYAIQTVLRRVLYNDKNHIDWQDFYENMKQQMPELTLMGESDRDIKLAVNKILEGSDVRKTLVEANISDNSPEAVKKIIMEFIRDNFNDFDGFDSNAYAGNEVRYFIKGTDPIQPWMRIGYDILNDNTYKVRCGYVYSFIPENYLDVFDSLSDAEYFESILDADVDFYEVDENYGPWHKITLSGSDDFQTSFKNALENSPLQSDAKELVSTFRKIIRRVISKFVSTGRKISG